MLKHIGVIYCIVKCMINISGLFLSFLKQIRYGIVLAIDYYVFFEGMTCQFLCLIFSLRRLLFQLCFTSLFRNVYVDHVEYICGIYLYFYFLKLRDICKNYKTKLYVFSFYCEITCLRLKTWIYILVDLNIVISNLVFVFFVGLNLKIVFQIVCDHKSYELCCICCLFQ